MTKYDKQAIMAEAIVESGLIFGICLTCKRKQVLTDANMKIIEKFAHRLNVRPESVVSAVMTCCKKPVYGEIVRIKASDISVIEQFIIS